MKKVILTFVMTVFALGLFAQDKDFSTINFFSLIYSERIYINDKLIGTVNRKEDFQFKIYSEGRLQLVTIVGEVRHILALDVKHGNNYYIDDGELTSENKGKRWVDRFTIVKGEEDQSNPLVVSKQTNSGPKQGTCFLVNKQGYMLTNYHVVSDAKNIQIKGIGNDFSSAMGAEIVAFDADNDLALLRLKNKNIQFENVPYNIISNINQQGTKSFVLGYPMTSAMGDEIKVTDGIINAKSGFKGTVSQYQFSAAVQPDNSGSPLFNDNGDVIGIINAKLQGAEGAGYAVKSPYILTFLKQIDNVTLDANTTPMSSLSLTEKTAKLKGFIFIVKTE